MTDWSRFLPIATKYFDLAFEMLGVDLKTAHQCSWVNYRAYLRVLHEIRKAIRDQGVEDVRLIDAHTFCWMLARLGEKISGEPLEAIAPPVAIKVVPASKALKTSKDAPADGKRGAVDWKSVREAQEEAGRLAEQIALESEQERLRHAGYPDLAASVTSVSDDHTLGYDIKSFDEDGSARHIEVKAARKGKGLIGFF